MPARASVVAELEGEAVALNLAHGRVNQTSFVAYCSFDQATLRRAAWERGLVGNQGDNPPGG